MKLRSVALALLACAVTSASAGSQPPLDFSYCTVCHGTQGNGNLAIRAPKIAGMEPWYLKRQLLAFRAGLRGVLPEDETGRAMQPMAAQLDDATIDQVVSYVGTFEPRTPPRTVQGNVKHGRKLYEACAACHGARAEGIEALGAPALASRSDWYLLTQLELFKAGLRGFSDEDVPGMQMRAAAAVLPDAEALRDVVAYINTLSPSSNR